MLILRPHFHVSSAACKARVAILLSGTTRTRNDAYTQTLAHARTPPILGETNGIDRAVAADGANNGAVVE